MFNKVTVKEVDRINEEDILIEVINGKGKLNKREVKDQNGILKEVIYLGNIPLIMTNLEYCPTCTTMIALAKGREEADEEVLKVLMDMNNINGLEDGVEKIEPILSLLDDGYYIVKEIEYYPTDGEGNYFWKINKEPKEYLASAEYYYSDYGSIPVKPKFLLPSQGTSSYNKERVEFYREKIRRGEKLFGLAMENRAGLSTLLDGHHKATAYYLEGKAISCITIANVHFYNYCGKDGIFYLGNSVPYINIKSANSIKRIFNKRIKKEKTINHNMTLENRYTDPIDIGDIKNKFPLYEEYALSTLAEDVSEEKINELLNYKGEDPVESIKEIFYYLRINNKERARKLCFSILNLEEFHEIWVEAVEYLCNYNDNEVQDIFVEALIKYDSYVGYDGMKFIIDEYFRNIN